MIEQELKKTKEEFYSKFKFYYPKYKGDIVEGKPIGWQSNPNMQDEVWSWIEAQLKKQRQEGYNDCIKHRIDDFNRNLKSREIAERYNHANTKE